MVGLGSRQIAHACLKSRAAALLALDLGEQQRRQQPAGVGQDNSDDLLPLQLA